MEVETSDAVVDVLEKNDRAIKCLKRDIQKARDDFSSWHREMLEEMERKLADVRCLEDRAVKLALSTQELSGNYGAVVPDELEREIERQDGECWALYTVATVLHDDVEFFLNA